MRQDAKVNDLNASWRGALLGLGALALGCTSPRAPAPRHPRGPADQVRRQAPGLKEVRRLLVAEGIAGPKAFLRIAASSKLGGWHSLLVSVGPRDEGAGPFRVLAALSPAGKGSSLLAPYRGEDRIHRFGDLGGAALLGLRAYEGGSGGMDHTLHIYCVRDGQVSSLGSLPGSSVSKSGGFSELCQAAKPEDSREVKVRRVGDLLRVTGRSVRYVRSKASGDPLQAERQESVVDETYALALSGLKRVR